MQLEAAFLGQIPLPHPVGLGRHFKQLFGGNQAQGLLQAHAHRGLRRLAMSAVEERILVSFFSRPTLMGMPPSRASTL